MVTRCTLAALALAAAPAAAETWRSLTGAEIAAALTGRTVIYGPDEQVFFPTGRTRHRLLGDRWGWWEVRGDAYCSLWPPREDWECFEVEQDMTGARLRFTDAEGQVTEGGIAE